MPGRYLDEDTLKRYVRSETTIDLPDYTAAIYGAEELIDGLLARRMEIASASTARVYAPGSYTDSLPLHDFTTLTSIVEHGVTLTLNTDFVLKPFNNLNDAGHTVPYNEAVRYWTPWYYDGPKATITVTAAWGWATIPYLVVEACKVAAKAILDGRDVRFGLATIAESGGVSEREAKTIRDAQRLYRSPRSWGIG